MIENKWFGLHGEREDELAFEAPESAKAALAATEFTCSCRRHRVDSRCPRHGHPVVVKDEAMQLRLVASDPEMKIPPWE